MARVCARRAAGIIVGEYLQRRGYGAMSNSAIDRLNLFMSLPEIAESYREVTQHFLLKVNRDHRLASDIDLIGDVIWLNEHLLNGSGL